MHVTFGLDLDGPTCPDVLTGVDAALGFPIVGRRGLLRLIETYCGLLGRYPPHGVRIASYAERLAAGDSPDRFFHRSLLRDRWGTARALLSWRDDLLLAGWNRLPCGQRRIDDLAEIETISSPVLPIGLPERVSAVLAELPSVRLPIETITHLEPLPLLPPHWRRMLQATGCALEAVPPPLPTSTPCDLASLQRLLLDPAVHARPVGDGTVLQLRAPDPWRTAECLAAWLAAHPEQARDCVVVRNGMEQILDQAMNRQGLPALGSASRSTCRPATQVLPLAFAIAWTPLDPCRLLQFLMLPASPVPARCSARLARVLRDSPGVGGSPWIAAWDELLAEEEQMEPVPMSSDDADLVAEEDLLAACRSVRSKSRRSLPRNKLERWLGPAAVSAYHPAEGMPRDVAVSIAARVAHWAEGRARAAGHDPALRAAAAQATDMRDILSLWRATDTIPRAQIEQILDDVQSSGSVAHVVPAQVGHFARVDAPGALLDDIPVVVWWNFTAPLQTRPRIRWSKEEIDATGLPLDDPRIAARRAAWRWRQPVLSARRLLVLACPDTDGGRPLAPHPLHAEIQARFVPTAEDERKITRDLSSLLHGPDPLPARQVAVSDPAPPPSTWRLPAGTSLTLSQESASSLQCLIACPLQWVLRYVLALHRGALGGLTDGSRLKGAVAHDVLEELLPPGPITLSPLEARNRALAAFDRRVSEQAAPLLLPERSVERLRLREEIGRAAAALIRVLRDAQCTIQGVEQERELSWEGTVLRGRLDVIAQRDGGDVLVDLKYGGSRSYRALLEDGRAVQLAAYAELAGTGNAVGYFSVLGAELLALERGTFPTATIVDGPGMAVTWERVRAARAQRLEQLARGVIDVAGHPDVRRDELALQLETPCGLCDYGPFCRVREAAHGS